MTKRILVTGANGQLGNELQQQAKTAPADWQWIFSDVDTLDITNLDAIEKLCQSENINTIINCAAYTAVDKAESDSSLADAINHQAVKHLASVSKQQGISLIHVSTDYVFDGANHKPYTENDLPCPINVYGKTKLDGELAMQAINPANSIIIRTAWVYSSFGNNFVKTMLRLGRERKELGVVSDQIGSPTYARDLAAAIVAIVPQLNNNSVELFHYTNEGVCSWYDFAHTIFELSGIGCAVNPINTSDYPTPAQRPHYSVLNKKALKNTFGITIPYWKDSLNDCLSALIADKT